MTRRHLLVTGGAGFIGSHLVARLLADGFAVTVLDNESTGNRLCVNPAATFVYGDVRNDSDLRPIFDRGVDAVFHVAGQASVRRSFLRPEDDLNVNVLGTINVIKQCIEHEVARLLFASSMTIYGNPSLVPTPESAPPGPVSYYGITKYAAERYVMTSSTRTDLNYPFSVTSMRMYNVYGRGQSLTNSYQGVFAILLGNILRGEPITIHSDGEQSRDFVHISDVVEAWVRALDEPQSYGQVINLGSGNPCSVNRLCDMVLRDFGHSRATYPVHFHPTQPGDLRASAADIRLAKTLLGWVPRMGFDAGMQDTIEWARSQYPRKPETHD